MPRSEFNAPGFYKALDSTREAKQLNWKQVANGSGVSASTLTRLAQGKRPDVDSMAALVNWSGLSADQFVTGVPRGAAEPLAQITALLSSDSRLNDESRETMIGMLTAAYSRLNKREV